MRFHIQSTAPSESSSAQDTVILVAKLAESGHNVEVIFLADAADVVADAATLELWSQLAEFPNIELLICAEALEKHTSVNMRGNEFSEKNAAIAEHFHIVGLTHILMQKDKADRCLFFQA